MHLTLVPKIKQSEEGRITRVLHHYVSEQIDDGVAIIDVIVALENTLRHVETLRKIG